MYINDEFGKWKINKTDDDGNVICKSLIEPSQKYEEEFIPKDFNNKEKEISLQERVLIMEELLLSQLTMEVEDETNK